MREWDSHQSRYHSNVQRRFRERSVIAQTETIIEYNNNAGDLIHYWVYIHEGSWKGSHFCITLFLVISSNCLFLKSDFTNFVALFCKRLRTFRAPADIPVSIYAFCSPIFQVCNNMHIFELESILMHFSTTLTYLTFHFGILQCKSFWIKKVTMQWEVV